MRNIPGKFVWFEHLSHDVPAAVRFYKALLGWQVTPMPIGGVPADLIQLRGGEAIGDFRRAAAGAPTQWTSYLSVDDVDTALAAAVAAGARMLLPATSFGAIGRGAALTDPTGATFWIWKSALDDGAEQVTVPIGDWYWNELCTPDPAAAAVFYERVFGLRSQRIGNNVTGDYLFLMKDGRARGGIVRPPGGSLSAMWLPYIHVEDCDAVAKRALRLGARSLVAPTDVTEIGRFAALADPLGAAFAVIRSYGVRLSEEEAASDADFGPWL